MIYRREKLIRSKGEHDPQQQQQWRRARLTHQIKATRKLAPTPNHGADEFIPVPRRVRMIGRLCCHEPSVQKSWNSCHMARKHIYAQVQGVWGLESVSTRFVVDERGSRTL